MKTNINGVKQGKTGEDEWRRRRNRGETEPQSDVCDQR
jgi:hypothetical protein